MLQMSGAKMKAMKYGSARVLTDDHTPALQLAALKKVGCKTVFKDEDLLGSTANRTVLLHCLKKLENGDTRKISTTSAFCITKGKEYRRNCIS
jgi:hypothetical protein